MKVCVTGGAGYIGSHLVAALIEKGHDVVVVDSLENGTRIHPKTRFFSHDIREIDQMEGALVGTDVFFHLAADKRATSKDYYDMMSVNLGGTTAVAEVAKRVGAKRFILASSAAVYSPKDTPCNEFDIHVKRKPANIYGLSKLQAEEVCAFLSDKDFVTVCLRYFNVWGGEYTPNAPVKSVIEHFIGNMTRDEPIEVYGQGAAIRDYVHVDDVVDANLLAMEYMPTKFDGNCHVFNVCTENGTSVIDLAKLVCGKGYPIRFQPERDNELQYSVGSTHLAKNELGFVAKRSLKELEVAHI